MGDLRFKEVNLKPPSAAYRAGVERSHGMLPGKVSILHLSDIHCGTSSNLDPTMCDVANYRRLKVLGGMIDAITTADRGFRPDIVVISGDVGWCGAKADYASAERYIRILLESLELTPDRLIMCPGNHDIDRKLVTYPFPETIGDCDRLLSYANFDLIAAPFVEFSQSCERLGVPPVQLGGIPNHLCGTRKILGITFNVLNSAWLCRKADQDRGKLCLGRDLLDYIAYHGGFASPDNFNTHTPIVTLIHHPGPWLRDDELYSYASREATYPYVALRSQIILSGHVHGLVDEPNRESAHALLFTGGATYQSCNYDNNFSLLQLDLNERTVSRRYSHFQVGYSRWDNLSAPKKYDLASPDCEQKDTVPIRIPETLTNMWEDEVSMRFATLEDAPAVGRFSYEAFGRADVSRANASLRTGKYIEWLRAHPQGLLLLHDKREGHLIGYSSMLRITKDTFDQYVQTGFDPWSLQADQCLAQDAPGQKYIFAHSLFCEGENHQFERLNHRGLALCTAYIKHLACYSGDITISRPMLCGPRYLRRTKQNAEELGYIWEGISSFGYDTYTCDFNQLKGDSGNKRYRVMKLVQQYLDLPETEDFQ